LNTDSFYFGGFLPPKSGKRQAALQQVKLQRTDKSVVSADVVSGACGTVGMRCDEDDVPMAICCWFVGEAVVKCLTVRIIISTAKQPAGTSVPETCLKQG
jgi:hypothetical protein